MTREPPIRAADGPGTASSDAVDAAASDVEAAASLLERTVTEADWEGVRAANAALHGALRALESAIAAGTCAESLEALHDRLRPVLVRHEDLTGKIADLRDEARDELASARRSHSGAVRYLESSE
ncbi:MAG TPA: hypothetical protein VFV10_13130 [Gammaproteobacteria bacterium]|nr:hypothetical protein [Gammaproteobacteria bacterium]